MPNKRIDQLNPNLNPLTCNELVPIFDNSSNNTERITLNELAAFVDNTTDTFLTGATYNNTNDTLSLLMANGNNLEVTINRYNRWFVPSGQTLTTPSNFQSFIYGDLVVEGTLSLEDNSQLVILNGDIILSGGTIIGSGTTYIVDLPETDLHVTSGTFNPITKQITFNGNLGFVPFNVDLSSLSTDNFYLTAGTYNTITKNIDFTGNDVVTDFSVDVSQLLDDTNTYTTGATLNGTIVEFSRNDISNAYSVDLSPLKFTGNTLADCIPNLFVSVINSCSQITLSGSVQQNNSVALGDFSHAEGSGTSALGIGTHSEGNVTIASGNY